MGGKVFIDKTTGNNPVSRIPNDLLEILTNEIVGKYFHLFDKITSVTSSDIRKKIDHGDIDIVVLGKNAKKLIREVSERFGYETSSAGPKDPMIHIKYPYKDKFYQIDFIISKNENNYNNYVSFYSNPMVFNAVVGHFARSIGYKFSTDGLKLHITDRKNQNYYYILTENFDKMFPLMGLPPIDEEVIYSSPENFANWIMSSERFDSDLFVKNHNHKSHRDSYSEDFCKKVYDILNASKKEAKQKSSKIDFNKNSIEDVKSLLKYEENILKKDIFEDLLKYCQMKNEVKKPILSGKVLLENGFSPGPILGEILKDVSNKFNKNSSQREILDYVQEKYKGRKG